MVPQYAVAFTDLAQGVCNWKMWGRLGWQEVKRRYRRTTIGPFWSTLSLGVFVFALGFVWANLWRQDVHAFLPYLCGGLLTWTLLTSIINESCSAFISAEAIIKQLQFSYSMIALSVVWRNIIVFGHNLIVMLLIYIVFQPSLSWAVILVVPGLFLIAINGLWIGILLGLACSRFRDIQQLVATILQVTLFITPIFWQPYQLGPRLIPFLRLNILYELVNVVRAPLLGQVPSLWSYGYVLLSAALGWAVTLYVFAWFRQRLPYWL